jgi:hypothetical protein
VARFVARRPYADRVRVPKAGDACIWKCPFCRKAIVDDGENLSPAALHNTKMHHRRRAHAHIPFAVWRGKHEKYSKAGIKRWRRCIDMAIQNRAIAQSFVHERAGKHGQHVLRMWRPTCTSGPKRWGCVRCRKLFVYSRFMQGAVKCERERRQLQSAEAKLQNKRLRGEAREEVQRRVRFFRGDPLDTFEEFRGSAVAEAAASSAGRTRSDRRQP